MSSWVVPTVESKLVVKWGGFAKKKEFALGVLELTLGTVEEQGRFVKLAKIRSGVRNWLLAPPRQKVS